MSLLKILVFEDVNDVASNWATSIGCAYPASDVEIANSDSFGRLVEVSNRRRSEWRKDAQGIGMVCEHEADKKRRGGRGLRPS